MLDEIHKKSNIQYVIHETKKYEIFSFNKKNRPISQKHVDELVTAIQARNLLSNYPIVVSCDMEVLDGQHRLTAAMQLGVPIFFIISADMSMSDVGQVNSRQNKWTGKDYLRHFVELGNREYVALNEFWQKYPWMRLASAIECCHYGDRLNHNSDISGGTYTANDVEFGHRVAAACLDFKPYISHYCDAVFVLSVRNLLSNSQYNHERMKRKLKFAGSKLMKCTDVVSSILNISEIYNFKESEKDRVELKKINSASKFFRQDRQEK
jgi:hypothetical protein